jgi:hypothetical protein
MITNNDIEDFCNDMKLDLVGVFSKDELPKEKRAGSYYINMEDHDKGDGTHWTMFKIFPCGKTIYFDSFGVYMPEPVRRWLLPFAPIAYNNRQIQDIKADTCGHYCEACDYFLKYDLDPKLTPFDNYENFLNMFSDNTKLNNKILKEYLQKR